MNVITTIAPLRKQFVVEAPQARAFRVFTEQLGDWWPLATHHIGKTAPTTAIIEPHVGGRWYERDADGGECLWGHVLAWEPPGRLVLSWELGCDFAHEQGLATEVEVRFVLVEPTRTRIEFEHRHLERFGEGAPVMREKIDGGWGAVLDCYVKWTTR
jgi:uncharacterized protein YndB with AHSA1/START domain